MVLPSGNVPSFLLSFSSLLPPILSLFLSLFLLPSFFLFFHFISISPNILLWKTSTCSKGDRLCYKQPSTHAYILPSVFGCIGFDTSLAIPLFIHPSIHVTFGAFQGRLQTPVPPHTSFSVFIIFRVFHWGMNYNLLHQPLAKGHIGVFSHVLHA